MKSKAWLGIAGVIIVAVVAYGAFRIVFQKDDARRPEVSQLPVAKPAPTKTAQPNARPNGPPVQNVRAPFDAPDALMNPDPPVDTIPDPGAPASGPVIVGTDERGLPLGPSDITPIPK